MSGKHETAVTVYLDVTVLFSAGQPVTVGSDILKEKMIQDRQH
jgi:hypothetical protein